MINDIKQDAQARMAKSIDALRHTLTTIRTGRASPFSETSVSNVCICTGTTLTACASEVRAASMLLSPPRRLSTNNTAMTGDSRTASARDRAATSPEARSCSQMAPCVTSMPSEITPARRAKGLSSGSRAKMNEP